MVVPCPRRFELRHFTVPFGEGGSVLSTRVLRHYTAKLRYSHRLRYRIVRTVVAWAPLVVFVILVVLVVGGAHT